MSQDEKRALGGPSHAKLKELLRDMALAVEIGGLRSHFVKRLRAVLAAPPAPDDEYDETFPWSPLSAQWWTLEGNRQAATKEQVRFAACWAACGDATKAARFAGIGEGSGHYKQAGYRALNSVAVGKLLKAAVREMQARRIPLPDKLRAYHPYARWLNP